jgi:SAM-dependent methyltransferase
MDKSQRKAEWTVVDDRSKAYHLEQWKSPKRSTMHFEEFAQQSLRACERVVDLGCGAGAATAYLASRHPKTSFIGVDLSPELIGMAQLLTPDNSKGNLEFRVDDWFNLGKYPPATGVVSLQSLSWLPEFEAPLDSIIKHFQPSWIGLSSLFYSGDISCTIDVLEHTRERRSFYNVYSLPAVGRFCESRGYRIARASPFVIDIDLMRPENPDLMATYTISNQGEPTLPERLQISGPLLMSWYFVSLERL